MSAGRLFRGDKVRIAKALPECMAHFPGAGTVATVNYAYNERYGGDNSLDYSLTVGSHGAVSWYPRGLLTLVKRRAKCPECGQRIK